MGCGRSTENKDGSGPLRGRTESQAQVVYNYNAEETNQHSLVKGEIITVIGMPNENGWVESRKNGKLGWVPDGFFEVIGTDVSVTVKPSSDKEEKKKTDVSCDITKKNDIEARQWDCKWEGRIVISNADKCGDDWHIALFISMGTMQSSSVAGDEQRQDCLLFEVTSASSQTRASKMMNKGEIMKMGMMDSSLIQEMKMDQLIKPLVMLCGSGNIEIQLTEETDRDPSLTEDTDRDDSDKYLTLVVSNPAKDKKFSLKLNKQQWDYRDTKVAWMEQEMAVKDDTIDKLSQRIKDLQRRDQ